MAFFFAFTFNTTTTTTTRTFLKKNTAKSSIEKIPIFNVTQRRIDVHCERRRNDWILTSICVDCLVCSAMACAMEKFETPENLINTFTFSVLIRNLHVKYTLFVRRRTWINCTKCVWLARCIWLVRGERGGRALGITNRKYQYKNHPSHHFEIGLTLCVGVCVVENWRKCAHLWKTFYGCNVQLLPLTMFASCHSHFDGADAKLQKSKSNQKLYMFSMDIGTILWVLCYKSQPNDF